jgi:phosphate-selective porin OprO/OprP
MGKFLFVLAVWLSTTSLVRGQATSDASGSSAAEQSVPTSSKTAPRVAFHHDGLWFSTHDGATQLRVHGYVQADDRMFYSNIQGEDLDVFLFRRIRPMFEGTLFNAMDFRFMPDFGQYNPQVQEAYLELKSVSVAKLRIGKFKEPIGLEVLKSDRDLTFAERSLASDLVPLRYIGAQVSGSVLSDSIAYAGGYFNGSNDGSNGIFTQWADANEGVARLFLRPFTTVNVNAIQQFGIGVAGSAGHQHGSIAGLKTVGQTTFFKYSSTAVASGQHNRISPQAYYYAGPFGVLSEYVLSSQDVLNNGIIRRIRNEAWQVAGSVMLTGEKNGYNGIRPHNAFAPTKGLRHLGAVELAVRHSHVRIDGDAFPLLADPKTAAQQANENGIGVNWFLNRYVKLTMDYEHTGFRMASGIVTPLHCESVLMSRIQLAF